MRLLWQKHVQEEDWGFILVDACNAFNEENCTSILWVVCHKWPSGARFEFNCYCHWATLVIRAGGGTNHFRYSKEGVTQGDPLAMLKYGLGIHPLIWDLRTIHPIVTQPCYGDDAEAGGTFMDIQLHLDDLMVRGPPWGYLPKLTKSILVVSPWNVPRAEDFSQGYGIQVVTRILCLGGFVGMKIAQY